MMLIENSFSKFNEDDRNKLQFYLCGFDNRGTVTEINKETGEQKQRPIKPEETVWNKYERIVTTNHTGCSKEYMDYLNRYTEEEFPNQMNEPYVVEK